MDEKDYLAANFIPSSIPTIIDMTLLYKMN